MIKLNIEVAKHFKITLQIPASVVAMGIAILL